MLTDAGNYNYQNDVTVNGTICGYIHDDAAGVFASCRHYSPAGGAEIIIPCVTAAATNAWTNDAALQKRRSCNISLLTDTHTARPARAVLKIFIAGSQIPLRKRLL